MIPECRHIQTSGGKCGSPALRGESYCYFHSPLPEGESTVRATPQEPSSLRLALSNLEDCAAIQHAISEVASALANNHIGPKRAATFLYGLQIASQNLNDADQIFSSEGPSPSVGPAVPKFIVKLQGIGNRP